MKILLLAYAISPIAGSEPGVGWAWFQAAQRVGRVTILISRSHEQAVRAAVPPEVDVEVWPVSSWPFEKVSEFAGRRQHLHYLAWLFNASVLLIRRRAVFDVAHHVTYATDWLPSPVIFARAARRIWGPVGGASYPKRSDRNWWTATGWRYESKRRISTGLARIVTGMLHRIRVDHAVALNPDAKAALSARGLREVDMRPNAAFDLQQDVLPKSARDPSTVVYVGRLVEWKGIKLAIDCLSQAKQHEWKLVVLGGGDVEFWRQYAASNGVAQSSIDFRGVVPRGVALQELAGARCLLLPGWHDSSPWAAAESASLGVPVVCLDRGGTALAADKLALPVTVGPNLPERLTQAVERAWSHPENGSPVDWSIDRLSVELGDWYTHEDRRDG